MLNRIRQIIVAIGKIAEALDKVDELLVLVPGAAVAMPFVAVALDALQELGKTAGTLITASDLTDAQKSKLRDELKTAKTRAVAAVERKKAREEDAKNQ